MAQRQLLAVLVAACLIATSCDAGASSTRSARVESSNGPVEVRCGGPSAPPDGRAGWRWVYEGHWVNDISHDQCDPGDSLGVIPEPGPRTYRATFDTGADDWTALTKPSQANLEWSPSEGASGGYVHSAGTWWIDTNHGPPGGAGDLHLVAYTFTHNLVANAHVHRIDLRNAEVSFAVRARDLDLKGSHVVFWIQTIPGRGQLATNFALTGRPLDSFLKEGEWTYVQLTLTTDPSAWTCLGSTEAKRDTYTCSALDDALKDVTLHFGFILFPVLARPGGAALVRGLLPTGEIGLDEFTMRYRLERID